MLHSKNLIFYKLNSDILKIRPGQGLLQIDFTSENDTNSKCIDKQKPVFK